MKKWRWRHVWSIKQGIFGSYFILIVALCVVICTSLLFFSKSVILDGIGQSRVDVLKQIAERTQAVKNSMITLSNLYSYDNNVTEALSMDPENVNAMSAPLSRNIRTLSIKYNDAYKDINLFPYVVLQGENGFHFCSNETYQYNYNKIKVELWYKNVVQNNGDIFWVSSYNDKNNMQEQKYVFSAARTVKVADSGESKGLLLVNIDERQLYDTY